MENKNVGFLILGIALLIIIIIFLFQNALQSVANTCPATHSGQLCPAHSAIAQQRYFSLAVAGILVIVGLFLVFSKPNERIVVKTIKEKQLKKKIDTHDLRPEDKKIFSMIQEQGAIFQADLIEKTGFGKAKISRIIDRLEGRGLVERKRRGMTNVVVMK